MCIGLCATDIGADSGGGDPDCAGGAGGAMNEGGTMPVRGEARDDAGLLHAEDASHRYVHGGAASGKSGAGGDT